MTQQEKQSLWEQAVAFHGHACGGLSIGYQASLYAMELLGLKRSSDEEAVCIVECDDCSVDAIQAILGCTLGKGNLILRLYGKHAYTFYDRASDKSVRLVLRSGGNWGGLEGMLAAGFHDMFDVKPAQTALPEQAHIYRSYTCAVCGEQAAENHIRLQDGEYRCEACYQAHVR